MTIDYLQNHKYRPRKSWTTEQRKKEEVNAYYKRILEQPSILGDKFAVLQLTEKDLYKHTIVEHIPFDYHHYMKHGELISNPSFLVAYYNPKTTQCELYAAGKGTFSKSI